ncbi:hypothetical protein KBY93_03875 [Synechococcus sp. J7-Johnson]|uniref:hypothetical protein n=1 Tax=Synechococcus sp. J7-Johnson TaxID=2823737 RepID=UPI0020CC1A29|nr:hypothetical protein [Synechococcus sp. J7-Johnson]MCP9839772.1 hypothetical protein [Synechococcus sp. J7-Johnson]
MIFKPKGFFLNLDKDAPAKPAVVAPVAATPAKDKGAKGKAAVKAEPAAAVAAPVGAAAVGAPAAAATPAAAASTSAAPALTTAEAIAAELRLEQENRPAPSVITFSPERLSPSGALPRARRRAGANMGMFKQMASGMLGR